MSFLQKAKAGSKEGFDVVWGWGMKLGNPVNKITNKIGSEAFWPSTIDNESAKAARILKSFCKDGYYTEEEQHPPPPASSTSTASTGPKQKAKVLVKIPQKVIQNCYGLAIFTTMRSGLYVSGAGGSGVLIARLPDGSWSPPSGILVHTLGVGFNIGIDIYDCVVVINTPEALKAFTTIRVTLGSEISVVAGPVGAGGLLEADARPNRDATPERVGKDGVITPAQAAENRTRKPTFAYMKSRGFYAGVQVDGTLIVERKDENAKFYGERVSVDQILTGRVPNVPSSVRILQETVRAAEGKQNIDHGLVNQVYSEPAPSDYSDIESRHEATDEEKLKYGTQAHTAQGGQGYTTPGATNAPYYPPPPQQGGQNYAGQYDSSQYAAQGQSHAAPAYVPFQDSAQGGLQGHPTQNNTNTPYYPPPPAGGPPHAQGNPAQASGTLPSYPPPPAGGPPHVAQGTTPQGYPDEKSGGDHLRYQ